jgi:hypothetical protein
MNAREELIELSKKMGILRMSAEGGLTTEQALAFLKKYGKTIEELSFPKELYGLLK